MLVILAICRQASEAARSALWVQRRSTALCSCINDPVSLNFKIF